MTNQGLGGGVDKWILGVTKIGVTAAGGVTKMSKMARGYQNEARGYQNEHFWGKLARGYQNEHFRG